MILLLRSIAGALNIVPGWLYAIMLAMSLATAAVERHHVSVLQDKLKIEQGERAKETAQRQAVALQAEQTNRIIETERANHAAQIVAAVTSEMDKTRAAVTERNAATERLRQLAADFAARGGGTAEHPATVASAEQAAGTLGQLLGDCSAMATDLAGRAEELASQVRGLQAAYHSLETKP